MATLLNISIINKLSQLFYLSPRYLLFLEVYNYVVHTLTTAWDGVFGTTYCYILAFTSLHHQDLTSHITGMQPQKIIQCSLSSCKLYRALQGGCPVATSIKQALI